MNINNFIKKEFDQFGPYEGIKQIKEKLIEKNAVVITENSEFLGLLTVKDVLVKSHILAIDCISEKPRLQQNTNIFNALCLMQQNNLDVISVYNNKDFVGLVFKDEIISELVSINESLNEQVLNLKNELNDLRKEKKNCEDVSVTKANEKQRILSIVVHDIKNPLCSIKSFAELLKKNHLHYPEKKTSEFFEIISYSINTCFDLLDNILIWSKSVSDDIPYKPEMVNIADLICEAEEYILLALYAKKLNLLKRF
jgi:two-component system, OmpR family, phosphate regulon sensor histidine kinase PhoR